METLGYIVTDRKINGIGGFIRQVSDMDLADPSKPILIVGWKKARGHEAYRTIIEWRLGDNLYWTFSKNENKSRYEDDLKKFIDIIFNNILNNIKYYYINIFKLKYNNIKKIYNIISSIEDKNIYISKDMVYIPYEGNVLGVSLSLLEFCKIPKCKVIDKIKSIGNARLTDDSNEFVRKLSVYVKDNRYVIPYLL